MGGMAYRLFVKFQFVKTTKCFQMNLPMGLEKREDGNTHIIGSILLRAVQLQKCHPETAYNTPKISI
jgi:hypothetical protein